MEDNYHVETTSEKRPQIAAQQQEFPPPFEEDERALIIAFQRG